jgi:hypothetical protein
MGIYIDKKSETINCIQNILQILFNINENNDPSSQFRDIIIQFKNYNWEDLFVQPLFENNSIYEMETNITQTVNVEEINELIIEFQKIDLQFLFNFKPFKELFIKIFGLYCSFQNNYMNSTRYNFFRFPFEPIPVVTTRRRNLIQYDINFPPIQQQTPPTPPEYDPPTYE